MSGPTQGVIGVPKSWWEGQSKGTKIAIISFVTLLILEGVALGLYSGDQASGWTERTLTASDKIGLYFGDAAAATVIIGLISELFVKSPRNPRRVRNFNDRKEPGVHRAPGQVSMQQARAKMIKNTHKAFEGAIPQEQEKSRVEKTGEYIRSDLTVDRVAELQDGIGNAQLNFDIGLYETIGPRETMEDARFYKETAQGLLTGVFDGHLGNEIARYVNGCFADRFFAKLAELDGNVHATFELVMHEMQEKIVDEFYYSKAGCTAVVTYVDRRTGLIYTATLGDSEAQLYNEQTELVTPLSVVTDWHSKNDLARVQLQDKNKFFTNDSKGKHKRIFSISETLTGQKKLSGGLNMSRAFGEVAFDGVMIAKPKITVAEGKKGDVICLASDGLFDYTKSHQRLNLMRKFKNQPRGLAKALTSEALKGMKGRGGDNVTVVVIKVK